MIETLTEGRISIAGQMIGLAQEAFIEAVPYTYERKPFGQPFGHFQGMQFQIAQAAIEIEAARLLTYNVARIKEKKEEFHKGSRDGQALCQSGRAQGRRRLYRMGRGVGFTRETGIEEFWRD